MEKYLSYDKLPRVSLLDHFFDAEVTLAAIKTCAYKERGDFAGGNYDFMPHRKTEEASVKFHRLGKVDGDPFSISKTISLMAGQSIANIEYEVVNNSNAPKEVLLGVEFNLTLLAGDAPDRSLILSGNPTKFKLNEEGEDLEISSLKLIDEWKGFGVSLEVEKAGKLFRFPIETISQSEGGLERTYQGTCLIFAFSLKLEPKAKWANKITVRMES